MDPAQAQTPQLPQIEAMRLGVMYRFEVKLREWSIYLRPLSVSEVFGVLSTVANRMNAQPVHVRSEMFQQLVFSQETLKRASTSDVDANDAQLTDMFLNRFSTEELAYLLKEYNAGCDGCNPSMEMLSAKQLNALVEMVKKNRPDETDSTLRSRLIERSFMDLVNLCQALLTKDDVPTDK